MRLPNRVSDALDAVTAADRAWFEAHPTKQWRIRPAQLAEHEAHFCVSLATRTSTPAEKPFVLVVRAPDELGMRIRWFMASPDEPCPFLLGCLAARTTAEFVAAFRPFLEPIAAPARRSAS